jgi:hypothetical protein
MRRILFAIALYVLLAPLSWAEKGFYLGGGATFGSIKVDQFRADQLGAKVSVGWRVMDYFAIEGSLQDWGTFRDTVNTVDIQADIDGYTVEALGILPTDGEVELFAKVGYYGLDADVTSAGLKGDETGALVGVGIMARPAERLTVRFDGTWYDLDDMAVSFSLGAYWNFGRDNK